MAEMNVALDEATKVSEALAAEAQASQEVVERLVKSATALGEKVDEVGGDAREKLADMARLLEEGEKELDGQAEAVKAALDAVQSKSTEVQEQVGELLAKIKDGVDELESAKEEVLGKLNSEADEKKAALEALVEKIKELKSEADGHLETAEGVIDKFKGSVDTARNAFKDTQEKLEGELDDFESQAKDTLEQLKGTMDSFMESGSSKLGELTEQLETMGTESIDKLTTQLVEETLGKLTEACGPLQEAFETLQSLCGENEDSVIGKFLEISEQVEKVTGILEDIKPALDLIESLV